MTSRGIVSDHFWMRPAVRLPVESDDARVARLVEAALNDGKRSPATIARYAGISTPQAQVEMRNRGLL